MSDHHSADGSLTLLAIGGGWLTEHVSHLVAGFPPGLIGPITTLLGGAILHVAAPYLRARGERLRDRALRRRSTVPRSRSVLVVDDHEGCRHLLAAMLREAMGLPVYEARSGAEARGLMARHHCGAVLCDLMLPDELGADVLAAIGRKGDVLMSGVAEADALDAAAHRVGAVAMRKPIDRARIVDHLTAALGAT